MSDYPEDDPPPKCDYAECKKRAFGIVMVRVQSGSAIRFLPLQVCPTHTQRAKKERT